MYQQDSFWDEEINFAPSLLLHRSYLLKYERSSLPLLAEKLLRSLKEYNELEHVPFPEDLAAHPDSLERYPRLIRQDVLRTFGRLDNQIMLGNVLTSFEKINGDYVQALSYVCAWLMMFLELPNVWKVVNYLHTNEYYIVEYWKSKAVNFCIDSYVFEYMIQQRFPQVFNHLQSLMIFPETYCEKWFVGLCTQVLPFDILFDFFRLFFEHGVVFLFQFGLSLIEHLQTDLLSTQQPSIIYATFRLDHETLSHKIDHTMMASIVNKAPSQEVTSFDIRQLRTMAYETKLADRIRYAREANAMDVEEEQEEENEEDGTCAKCGNMMADIACSDCHISMCQRCVERDHPYAAHAIKFLD